MMTCSARHPGTDQVCQETGPHRDHFALRLVTGAYRPEEITWPNEDYVARVDPREQTAEVMTRVHTAAKRIRAEQRRSRDGGL